MIMGRVQQPITDFTWPWDDDFITVQGGNRPLLLFFVVVEARGMQCRGDDVEEWKC
jgi:hypothetical protein